MSSVYYTTVHNMSEFMSDVCKGMACRTLPILLESVVLNVRFCFADCDKKYSHLLTALCERHCKITKYFENVYNRDVKYFVSE